MCIGKGWEQRSPSRQHASPSGRRQHASPSGRAKPRRQQQSARPAPAQVTNFVSEVEHLVKLGCDRGKATAAFEKYNDVEKALDACLEQVTEEKSPRANRRPSPGPWGSHEKASPGRASRSPANRASPRGAKADASPARRSSPRQPAAPPASRPSPAQKRLDMEAANAHVIKPNASR